MATNQLSLLRQWHMLRLLPRAPAKISVRDICERLADQEFIVTDRTVQRDLNELSQVFPLTVDDRAKPFGWSWQKNGASFDLPGLDVPGALTLKLVEQHLRYSLPPATLDALQPHFQSASRALSAVQGKANSKAWLDKVRTVPPVQPLLPPPMNKDVQRTVYDALMQDRQLKLGYMKRDAKTAILYESVHPLGVVQRGQLIYLVCHFSDYNDVRTIALHRVISAEMLYVPARKNSSFSIDAYIESGQMGVLTGEPVMLKALFSRVAGEHLFETPLAKKQSLHVMEDGRLQLTVTVPNTKELRWWLLGMGVGVEVICPESLRMEMKTIVDQLAKTYQ